VELKRRLYTRGSSYETTIPKPLLFSLNLSKKQLVRFVYDDEQQRWYLGFEEAEMPNSKRGNLDFEEKGGKSPDDEPRGRKARTGAKQ
jgi:hypothetical protein